MTTLRQSWEFQAAGTATMARQIILSVADLGGLLPDAAVDILAFMGSPLHTLDVVQTVNRVIDY